MDKVLSLLSGTYTLLGLGFAAATLIALLVAPAIWRKAAARTRQRIEDHTHLTLEEIGVDKQKLRSQMAVTSRKLDIAVEDWQDSAALQLVKFDKVNEECSSTLARIELQDETLAKLEHEVSAMRSQVGEMHKEVKDQLSRLQEQSHELSLQSSKYKQIQNMLTEASTLADKRKVEVVALRKEIASLNSRIDQSSDGARELRAERAELTQKVEHAESELASLTEELEILRDRLAKRDVEVADLSSQLMSKQKQYNAQTEQSSSQAFDLRRQHEREVEQIRADYDAKVSLLKEEKARLEKEIGSVLKSLKSELIRERAANDQMRSNMGANGEKRPELPDAAQLFDEAETALSELAQATAESREEEPAHGHPFRNAVFSSMSERGRKPAIA